MEDKVINQGKSEYLTWDDLAGFYKKKTGKTARIKPMHVVYSWAIKQKEIVESENGLILKEGK
jgi:hypothetical protein